MYQANIKEQIILYAVRLKEERKASSYTLERLAELAGTSKQVLSRIENRKNYSINMSLAERISRHLNCSTDYLIGKAPSKDRINNDYSYTIKPVVKDYSELDLKERLFKICAKDHSLLQAFLSCVETSSQKQKNVLKNILESFSKLN